MALLAFEHAIAEKNLFRKIVLSLGNRNEIIHSEIILPTQNLRLSAWEGGGVEYRKFSDIKPNEFVLFDLGSSVDVQVLDYFSARKGKGYDKVALFTDMLLQLNLKANEKYFCSEICYSLLKYELKLDFPDRVPSSVSPQQLYQMALDAGLKQVYL